ncbi:MAG: NADH:flavin oxidoreductase [Candidatus Acidiferrum sp.]
MNLREIVRLGSVRDVAHFQEYLATLNLTIPCDSELISGPESPLTQPIVRSGENGQSPIKIGNRIAIHPMEGWDGTTDGNPSEHTVRRWRRFGASGAKLIWGGEAAAVCHEGRANPNQLLASAREGLARLRTALIEEHRRVAGSDEGLLIGLQLTHSGRYSCPNQKGRMEPRILYRHPVLDRRMNLAADHAVLTDGEIEGIVEQFHRAASTASELGFGFVDVKHCHGYLGHEFLSAHTREGKYGGSFENRTRFLREVVKGIRAAAPGLRIGVRLSAFDTIAYCPDPALSTPGKLGPGIPEDCQDLLPYRWGFGVKQNDPRESDASETLQFFTLLEQLGIQLVNVTAGSPYYNPHIQRPALYPPSDGYQPPEDPLIGVARQMGMVKKLKEKFPKLIVVGSAYSYLQDFLPHVAQAAVRLDWVDSVGLGRMVLSYPEILSDVVAGRTFQHKLVCRTFSDCTTAPRNGLVSGCYPLDSYYKKSPAAELLKVAKARR